MTTGYSATTAVAPFEKKHGTKRKRSDTLEPKIQLAVAAGIVSEAELKNIPWLSGRMFTIQCVRKSEKKQTPKQDKNYLIWFKETLNDGWESKLETVRKFIPRLAENSEEQEKFSSFLIKCETFTNKMNAAINKQLNSYRNEMHISAEILKTMREEYAKLKAEHKTDDAANKYFKQHIRIWQQHCQKLVHLKEFYQQQQKYLLNEEQSSHIKQCVEYCDLYISRCNEFMKANPYRCSLFAPAPAPQPAATTAALAAAMKDGKTVITAASGSSSSTSMAAKLVADAKTAAAPNSSSSSSAPPNPQHS